MSEPKPNIQQLLNNKISNNQQLFDIDNWITDYENGFLSFIALMKNDELKKGYWGVAQDEKPKINELNNESNAQEEEGYRVIEFLPNRDNQKETYPFFGTPLTLQLQIGIFHNIWRMFNEHLGVQGQWVGYPLDDYLREKPRTGISVQVWLSSQKRPPFYIKKKDIYTTNRFITIPDVDKSKLTYDAIRLACGGNTGQNWGNWSARAYLKTAHGVSQMVSGGSSQQTAIKNLESFLGFTNAKLVKMTTHEINKDQAKAKFLGSPETWKFDLFPAWITVFNTALADYNYKLGQPSLDGKILSSNKGRKKLAIYTEAQPSWFAQQLKNDLKNPLIPDTESEEV